jgi:uncharacterized protein YkwD
VRHRLRVVALLLVAGLPFAAGATAVERDPTPDSARVRELARLVNAHRRSRGLGTLAWHEGAARVARAHADDMAERQFFGHVNPDGFGPFQRLRAAGIGYRAAAENVASGYVTPRHVLADWLASRGHRQNLEDPRYTHHGIGLVRGHWTHVFLEPAPPRRSR